MALVAVACADPEDPSPTKMAYGDWYVLEVYVNDQVNPSDVIQRFTLERDGSYILVDENEFATVGTWVATDAALTLSGADGSVMDFTIEFQSYQKMRLLQTIESPSAGTIEIRYLMNKDSDGSTY
jgi:hypothetical protein